MKKLLLSLYKASTDEEVTKLLSEREDLQWKEYGDNEDNTTIINGQMDDPIRCLIENLVNGIDATKMLKAKLDGVDLKNPFDPKMPKNSKEALKRYFNIDKPLYEYSESEIKKLTSIGIYFERSQANSSSIIIYDNGEGQNPEDFTKTLLSLGKGNKASLPFVQGKYNMGSTGVLKKCNGHRYQLIISMKNKLLKESNGKIGFTIIRYADSAKKGKKYKTYEYLTIDEKIPSVKFDSEIKKELKVNNDILNNFNGGCIRKLYDYNTANVFVHGKFNSLFSDTGLPIKLSTWNIKEKKITNRYIKGALNDINLAKKRGELLLAKETEMVLKCGTAKIKYFVFEPKKETEQTVEARYINGHSVSFIDNGQNNGDLPRTFLSNDCELNQIAKNMMVFIDTSDLPTEDMADVYKPSRDRIDETMPLSKTIKNQLKDILMGDEDLIALNEKFKGKSLYNANAAELARNAIENLANNENIRKLLTSDDGDILKKMAGLTEKRTRSKEEISSYKEKAKKKNNAIVSLRKDETKKTTIAYGKSGTIELELGSSVEELDIMESDNLIIDINSVFTKHEKTKTKGKKKKEREINNTYSKVIENGKLKVLVNPSTMGYYAEEKFAINFKHLNDKTFNAVVEITVIEGEKKPKEEGKKNYLGRISGPELCLTSKKGSSEGVISWDELPSPMNEQDVCKIIVSKTMIEKIYINLDSELYHKKFSTGTMDEKNKNQYISNVYSQTIIGYLSQASSFAKMFEENEKMNEFKDIIIEKLISGTEATIKNMVDMTS